MNGVAVALVLFDSRSEVDPFAGVTYWARAVDAAVTDSPPAKLLVAARIDRGGLAVSRERIEGFLQGFGFAALIETSAKRGDGIAQLL